jgi:phosphomannomutase
MIDRYMTEIGKRYCFHKSENKDAKLRITYTAMHGVGADFVVRALQSFNLPAYIDVKEQNTPDPEFPTVKFPNPEEGKGALALSIKTAEKEGSNLIVANDPDADRMAAAERDSKSGEWTIFNGNEIAALLADWTWTNFLKQNPSADKSKCVMLSSTVSSQILRAMAEKEGFRFIGTLTGFKWMGNVAHDVIQQKLTFLFAFEVEIGFLVGDLSLDKDGVRTAAIFYEMANQWALKGVSLTQRLDQLYKKYGYFTMNTSYFFVDQPEKMMKIFARLRTMNSGSYPDKCGKYKIASVRDVTLGYDSAEKGNVCALPKTPESQMLTFRFENGATATMRGSGTEPKLKYYVECCDAESQAKSRALTDDMTAAIIAEFMQPDINGLVAPKK